MGIGLPSEVRWRENGMRVGMGRLDAEYEVTMLVLKLWVTVAGLDTRVGETVAAGLPRRDGKFVTIRAVRGVGLAWIRDVDWMVRRFGGDGRVVVVTKRVEKREEVEAVEDEEMGSPGGTEGVAGGGAINLDRVKEGEGGGGGSGGQQECCVCEPSLVRSEVFAAHRRWIYSI